jgi:hypothetical protein
MLFRHHGPAVAEQLASKKKQIAKSVLKIESEGANEGPHRNPKGTKGRVSSVGLFRNVT